MTPHLHHQPDDNGDTTTHQSSSSWFSMSYEERWSPSSLQRVAAIWSLDEEKDIANLLTLKDRLSDLKDYPLNDPLELARCYYDAHFKVHAAEMKFRKLVEWRQREGIDDLLLESSSNSIPQYVHTYFPSCWLAGVDKEGDPIWMDRTGASDAWPVYQQYGPVPFRNYVLWVRENGLRGDFARDYERRYGRPPARVTAILDMEGLCRRHLQAGLIAPLEEGIRIVQEYYGGMAKHIFVVRAPFVFRLVWSIAQHFCNDSLKKTIVFCNAKNTQSTLDKYIDRAVLPPSLCPSEGQGVPGVGFERSGNLQGGIMPDPSSCSRKLKLSGSNETVSSCDSFSVDGSTIVTTPPSPASSLSSRCDNNKVADHSNTSGVRATSLLSGYLAEDSRVLLEF